LAPCSDGRTIVRDSHIESVGAYLAVLIRVLQLLAYGMTTLALGQNPRLVLRGHCVKPLLTLLSLVSTGKGDKALDLFGANHGLPRQVFARNLKPRLAGQLDRGLHGRTSVLISWCVVVDDLPLFCVVDQLVLPWQLVK
jgi:hypothetical protein